MDIEDLNNIDLPEIPKLAQGFVTPLIASHSREQVDSENIQRSADNSEYFLKEIHKLRNELQEERSRAKIAEKSNRRLSFLLGILGGLLSGILPYIFDWAFSLW